MTPPTIQKVALAVLRDQGITSLAPATAQPNVIRPSDVDAVALSITSALQEIAQESAGEQLTQPGSDYIHAPTIVTFTATQGSKTISAFATWQSWMEGCTVRASGDDQDNELLSATQLARPYAGTSASGISATVYQDSLNLDDTVEKPIGPMTLTANRQVFEVSSRQEFMLRSGYPVFTGYAAGQQTSPGFAALPFWALGPKPADQFPTVFFLDTYYSATKGYVVRRIRLSPMPTQAQAIGWTNKMTPIRVTAADIVSPLTTLSTSGATSDTNANQSYTYLCDVNGYRMFAGVTHPQYAIFYHPGLAGYILCATLNVAATPAAYWSSDLGSSPLGNFSIGGTATGAITVTTSDAGGGAADPGTVITLPNGWVESILIPIARQCAAGLPTFKNDGIRPEIQRQYGRALNRLHQSNVSSAPATTLYT